MCQFESHGQNVKQLQKQLLQMSVDRCANWDQIVDRVSSKHKVAVEWMNRDLNFSGSKQTFPYNRRDLSCC